MGFYLLLLCLLELRYGRERTKHLWLYTSPPRRFLVHRRNFILKPNNLSRFHWPFHCQ